MNDLTDCKGQDHEGDQAEEDKFQADREPDPPDRHLGAPAARIAIGGLSLEGGMAVIAGGLAHPGEKYARPPRSPIG